MANRSSVEEIKARLPIEEVIASYVKLEKAGKSFKAKCPFHNEKSASFFISPERGGYYCFGCNAKGDIFTFVEQFEGLDFRGALKLLAERAGVQLVVNEKADGERDRLYQVMEEAAKYFEAQFSNSKEAKDYIKGRGITDETRTLFRIGWAPEGWRNLSTYLKGKGFSETLIEKAGLIKKSEKGDAAPSAPGQSSNATVNFYDRFRGRIMFPISDSSGRVIAFTGRILKTDDMSAKYLNSPDTPLYDKSVVLYGLDKAKSDIRRLGYAILVEGQMDLVMSHQAGVKNTVAASGTALTDEATDKNGMISNLGLVRRLSPNIIVAFDSDDAGRKAAMRAAGIALSMGMDVKIADIVGGKDPADLVKENADTWKDTLRTAKPVIEFELINVLREVTDQRKLAKAIEVRILPLVARIESSSDQSFFVQMIADKTRIPSDAIWRDVRIAADRAKKEAAAAVPNSASTNSSAANSTGNNSGSYQSVRPNPRMSSEIPKRIDLIERRLFGLLHLMEKDSYTKATEYRDNIKKLAGKSYEERQNRAETMKSDLAFEAETFFGAAKQDWDKIMNELLLNFEEDMIGDELMDAMHELKNAERAGDAKMVAEYAQKCQALSMRKAEIGKRRRA